MVPKEPYTIKRNQTTVVCVVYKLLIMDDSAHTSGFAVCTAAQRRVGSCPPAAGNAGGHTPPPPNTDPATQPCGRSDAEDLGAGGSRSCSSGPCVQLAPRPRTKAPWERLEAGWVQAAAPAHRISLLIPMLCLQGSQ